MPAGHETSDADTHVESQLAGHEARGINLKSDGQDIGYDTAIPDMAVSHEAPLASSFRHLISARG